MDITLKGQCLNETCRPDDVFGFAPNVFEVQLELQTI